MFFLRPPACAGLYPRLIPALVSSDAPPFTRWCTSFASRIRGAPLIPQRGLETGED